MRDSEYRIVVAFAATLLIIIGFLMLVKCEGGNSYYHIPGTSHSTGEHGVNKPAQKSNPFKGGSTRRR